MKNFTIGKELTAILTNDSEITAIVGNRIFPLVADAGTNFPFIVYRRNGYRPYNNKDYSDEMAMIELAILSDNYTDGVELADLVSDTLEKKSTNTIDEILIENSSEDYSDNTYIQKINLTIKIK